MQQMSDAQHHKRDEEFERMDERDHYRAFADSLAADNERLKAALAKAEQALRAWEEWRDQALGLGKHYRGSIGLYCWVISGGLTADDKPDLVCKHCYVRFVATVEGRPHAEDCPVSAALRAIAGEPAQTDQ